MMVSFAILDSRLYIGLGYSYIDVCDLTYDLKGAALSVTLSNQRPFKMKNLKTVTWVELMAACPSENCLFIADTAHNM